jgi:P27 family predicted phage terminase small subunit
MPNPPIPTYLKLLRGNPGKRPIRSEPEPAIADDVPDPPVFLSGYARDEWWRVAPELYRLKLLTLIDIAAFAAYCQAFARWRSAEEVLAEMAKHDPETHGLLGGTGQNPLVRIAANAAADMVRYAGEFGMSPAARTRIRAGVGARSDASKFDGLIA